MTKSRIALPILCAAAWPGAALAQPPAATAEEAIAAYDQWYEEVTDGTRGLRRCRRDAGGGDDIVVCGRTDDRSMRVPYVPIAGQVHRIAGEMPTGADAAAADRCLRLCYQPVMVDVGEAVRFLGRGLDRILHPD